MNVLIYAVTALLVICCLLLIGVVLLQRPRSEGLGTAFGGGMTESLFGAGTSDVLTKITIWLAAAFFICTLLLAIFMSHKKHQNSSVLKSTLTPAATATVPAAQPDSIPAQSPKSAGSAESGKSTAPDAAPVPAPAENSPSSTEKAE